MAPKPTCECGECPKCKRRVYMRDWYARNAEQHRETARQSKLRRADKVRDYNRVYWRENRDRYRQRHRARKAVFDAIRRGDLVRGSCEREAESACRGRIEGHHDDYDKPLEVRWLCAKHHGELGRR